MILVIDNYDSFSYNLVQYIGSIQRSKIENATPSGKYDDVSQEHESVQDSDMSQKNKCVCRIQDYLEEYGIKVVRNDELTVSDVEKLRPDHIILSPGPGRPENAGICESLLREYSGNAKILGVCLGHQAIIEAFGGKIVYAKELMHGKQSRITFDADEEVFAGIPENVKVARYHSLAGEDASIPDCLSVIAKTDDGEVMAVKHNERDIYGFQFHPESVLTEYGMKMMENFLA